MDIIKIRNITQNIEDCAVIINQNPHKINDTFIFPDIRYKIYHSNFLLAVIIIVIIIINNIIIKKKNKNNY